MKIVYYTDQTYQHGGIERVLANKINYFVNQENTEVHLITSEQKEKPHCYPTDERLIEHDLGINYNRSKSYFNLSNLLKVPNHCFKLREKLNELQADIFVVCNYDFAFYFVPFLNRTSFKIKEYHSSRHFESRKRGLNKSIIKKLVYNLKDYIERKYDYLALLTADEQRHFKSKNTIVIPNGIAGISKTKASLKSKKIISAGRIAPVKGFNRLIDVFSDVVKKYPEWKLEIFGDGERNYVSQLQQKINTLGLQENVYLRGQTEHLQEKMLEASMYVMTSETECFPMVLLEAKSCGLPVVSFDCPYGPRNIITDKKDGFLVENQDNTKLGEAIRQLIDSDILRKELGNKGQENMSKFDLSTIMKQWMTLFNGLLRNDNQRL